jgi:HSP20 family protein
MVARSNVALTRAASIVDELEQVRHRISVRAYELFRASGAWDSPDDDWLQAERELLWQPAVEVSQKDGRFEVRAAVAGVDPKDLDLTVTSEHLLIKGSGAHKHRAEIGAVYYCEFSGGQLFRAIQFPESIDAANVTAECRNGLLKVTAPLAQSEAVRKTVKRKGRR